MRFEDIDEGVAGPEKCWPGYRKVGTKPGTGKNAGKRVNDCEKIKEGLTDEVNPADAGEYDREGDMAMGQLKTAEDAASELRSILDSDENLPEWVQSKITKAVDYLDTARDYMKSKEQGTTESTDYEKSIPPGADEGRIKWKCPSCGTASGIAAFRTNNYKCPSCDEALPVKGQMGLKNQPAGLSKGVAEERTSALSQAVAEAGTLDRYRDRIGTSGQSDRYRDRQERRHERDQEYDDASHQSRLNRLAADDQNYASWRQNQSDRDAHRTTRMQKDDDDWEKTFDMMRDRINRYQWSSQRDVDPEQLAAISNIKYEPKKKNEAVQAKTDDKLLAYYAQRKAEEEKKKKEQGVAEAGGRRYTSYHDELSSRERAEQDYMDQSKRDFKRAELQHELGHEDDPNFERNLRQQQIDRDRGPWYIRIDGKVYKQKGVAKSFDWKRGANNYALAMIKNNPSLRGKVLLTKSAEDK
jgi:hypothetical protein